MLWSGAKPTSATHIKKAWAASQSSFKLKSLVLLSQGRFLWKDEDPDFAEASFRDF